MRWWRSPPARPEPGQTVKSTEVTLGAAGYQGKVKAANSSCVGERTVVLKQKGNGVLSRVKSKANGNWKADLEELNENIKIPADGLRRSEGVLSGDRGPVTNAARRSRRRSKSPAAELSDGRVRAL